jgi:hypothetical protein
MAISLTHTTVAVGTDAGNGEIGKAQWNEAHTLTMATGNLLGRSTSGTGAAEEIAIGTGLDLTGGTLSSTVTATPGGSDTQVQFNDGGSFGADAGLTFNKTSKAITLGGATVTTDSPVINAAQTWNAVGTTFTGLKFNATDTASAAGSLLMDLQVGGASQFSIGKAGEIVTDSYNVWLGSTGTTAATIRVGANSLRNLIVGGTASANNWASFSTLGFQLNSSLAMQWAGGALNTAADLILTRRAAANLRFGAADAAAPVAQTLSVQSVVAGTSNTAGANLTITGSQGTGTGAGGSIIFRVAPAGSSGTAQNALATALTIDSTRLATFADAVKTAAPSGGTSGNWKLGVRVAATTTLDTTQYIELDVGGTLYKLAVVTS